MRWSQALARPLHQPDIIRILPLDNADTIAAETLSYWQKPPLAEVCLITCAHASKTWRKALKLKITPKQMAIEMHDRILGELTRIPLAVQRLTSDREQGLKPIASQLDEKCINSLHY